jgi:hypothetical protein
VCQITAIALIVMARGLSWPCTPFVDARSNDVDGEAKMLWGWTVAAACILAVVQPEKEPKAAENIP